MKVIPVLHCRNLAASLHFYTHLLDFRVRTENTQTSCAIIRNGFAEIQLSTTEGIFGNAVLIRVENVDRLFENYAANGAINRHEAGSLENGHPVNRSWGVREFCLEDPDGNTLRFFQPVI